MAECKNIMVYVETAEGNPGDDAQIWKNELGDSRVGF